MPGPTKMPLRARGVAPLAAIGFVIVVVLVFNATNWRMMRLLEQSKEEDLTRRVRSVTRVAARELTFPSPPDILDTLHGVSLEEQSAQLDAFPDSSAYEELAQRIAGLKEGSGLAQILLLTPTGSVVVDSNFRFLTGEPLPFTIDKQYLDAALQGHTATTPLYAWEGEHFQRDYESVVDDTGTTLGVIMGSISADYLESLQEVRGAVFRLWVLSSIVLLLLGLWLYRMFRYVARLEHHALQRVRVEAMGALAAGMAHELRNPLAIIRALAEEIQADQQRPNRSTENADDIINETQRLSELVNHFLSLSRAPEPGEGVPVNLNEEIERVAQLMRKGAPTELSITLDLPANPIWINGDPKAVRQLLLNLFVNAREAIEGSSGQIDVTLRERRREAELRIADTGPGIPPKMLSRVFEPFYTTRANGTGLGLSISRTIAVNLGGELTLENSGRGATAVVILPVKAAD